MKVTPGLLHAGLLGFAGNKRTNVLIATLTGIILCILLTNALVVEVGPLDCIVTTRGSPMYEDKFDRHALDRPMQQAMTACCACTYVAGRSGNTGSLHDQRSLPYAGTQASQTWFDFKILFMLRCSA